jgi:hypothetical protein
VESRMASYSQSRQPRGSLVLRLSVGFWGANDPRSFPEFLDAVESDLRQPEAVLSLATKRQESIRERR